jgi:DNA-binding transcriptional ArsR family regulator
MVGRNFTDEPLVDMHWTNPAGPDVLVEIRRTHTARDVREGLLALAYAVQSTPRPSMGLCVILDSRLSWKRLAEELGRFRSVARPEIAQRIFLVRAETQREFPIDGELPEHSDRFMRALRAAIQDETAATSATRVTRQQVKAVLVERWLSKLAPMTLAELRRSTGSSYQTASAALSELERLDVVTGERDGPVRLHGLRPFALMKLAEEHALARKLVRYTDPTGDGRMPSALADRLLSLRQKGVAVNTAISGVLGATRYFRELDITDAPRLDVSVYDGDVRFVSKLDAGLVVVDDPKRKATVVLHLQRDCRPQEVVAQEPDLAARLDCLADLEQMGLQAEARDFAHQLCEAARRTS